MKTRLIIFGFCFLLSAFSRGQGWLPTYFGGSLKSTNATVTLLDELTLTNGLFAVWHLDETGTGTRYDSWGTNHLYVRATANVTNTNGMLGNAVNVTAAANGGDLTNDAAGMNFTDFAVSLWIYPKVNSVTAIYCGTVTDHRQYNSNCFWGINLGTYIRPVITNTLYNAVGSTFNLNEWTHFTVVYSNSAARHWIYRNGVLVNSIASGTLGETSPTSFALVGKSDYGMRDEVMIWSRGLTPAEAALVYRMGQFKKWPERWR
jgi:hypothetical protein